MLLTPAQIKPKSFESRRTFFLSFLPGVDVPHVYVRAWALGCFHSLVCTLRASLSGTFLQTQPDLVTPLKGHSSETCTERFGTDKTVEAG